MSHHFLRFQGVHYRYPDGHEALKGVSFELRHGERAALMGVNGAGKSTLLLHTNGLLLPTQGEVNLGGMRLTSRTVKTARQTVGLIFQDPDNQLFMPSVWEDVAFGPQNMGLTPEEIDQRVDEALAAVGASDLKDATPYQLSGGQKKRVAIATVLSMQPSVLVMDEPTASLDPHARRQLIDLLEGFTHTMLIATHDPELALELCPRTLILADGRLEADGTSSEILRNEELLRRTGLDSRG